ncbi:MAG TPA: hypothetical protein VNO14_06090 [Blastocatellia bacterium]|nr:hypothetical protein [Blastocatellia bacterium]
MQDLQSIPEMSRLLKSRVKGSDKQEGAGLEGMEVALTINGMILSSGEPEKGIDNWCAAENSLENFDRLLSALKQNEMPPTVSFVSAPSLDPVIAERWVRSGNLIGSLAKKKFKGLKKDIQVIIDHIMQNDAPLAPYWRMQRSNQRYIRFPKLKTARDPQMREDLESFLKSRRYVEAPATIDARDSRFSQIYCASLERNEAPCASLVKQHFKSFLLDTSIRARKAARKLAGREIKHILMIRANQFSIDILAELLAWYRGLGVRFITLEEALSDPFYSLRDEKGRYYGKLVINKVRRAQTLAADSDE